MRRWREKQALWSRHAFHSVGDSCMYYFAILSSSSCSAQIHFGSNKAWTVWCPRKMFVYSLLLVFSPNPSYTTCFVVKKSWRSSLEDKQCMQQTQRTCCWRRGGGTQTGLFCGFAFSGIFYSFDEPGRKTGKDSGKEKRREETRGGRNTHTLSL